MTSTVKKGYSKEKLCRDKLIDDGYTIVFKSVRWKFGTIDFAKLFDVVAINENTWRFISVKHFGNSNNYLDHQRLIQEFKQIYGLPKMSFELWLWETPRWTGRNPNKVWHKGGWIIKVL